MDRRGFTPDATDRGRQSVVEIAERNTRGCPGRRNTGQGFKERFQALDNPKLIGVVVNEATEFDQAGYAVSITAAQSTVNKSAQ